MPKLGPLLRKILKKNEKGGYLNKILSYSLTRDGDSSRLLKVDKGPVSASIKKGPSRNKGRLPKLTAYEKNVYSTLNAILSSYISNSVLKTQTQS